MTGTMVYPDVWWRYDAVGLRETPATGVVPGDYGRRSTETKES
jgi:hypothetical protein